jgi:hypothetical protein
VRRALFGVGLRAACRGMLRRVSFHPPPGIAASDPFDVDRGIDTAGFCSWRVLDSGQTSDPYNAGYLPAEPAAVRVLLSCLRNPTAYTFLDLGCGKGRVLALAAEAGFQRIIGVEINPALAGSHNRMQLDWGDPPRLKYGTWTQRMFPCPASRWRCFSITRSGGQ